MVGYPSFDYKGILKYLQREIGDFSDKPYTFLDILQAFGDEPVLVITDKGASYLQSIQFDYAKGEIYIPIMVGEKQVVTKHTPSSKKLLDKVFGEDAFYYNNQIERYIIYKYNKDKEAYILQVDYLDILTTARPQYFRIILQKDLPLADTSNLTAEQLFNDYILSYYKSLDKPFRGLYLYNNKTIKALCKKYNVSFYKGYVEETTSPVRVYSKIDVQRFLNREYIDLHTQLQAYYMFNCCLVNLISTKQDLGGFENNRNFKDILTGKSKFIKYCKKPFSLVLTRDILVK